MARPPRQEVETAVAMEAGAQAAVWASMDSKVALAGMAKEEGDARFSKWDLTAKFKIQPNQEQTTKILLRPADNLDRLRPRTPFK